MEKIKNLETRKIAIFALILLPVLITLIAVSYAFFSSITSNENKESLTLTSGSLELTFKDNNQGNIDASMEFGDVLRKEFVLENTGTRDVIAKISWKDLVNTYLFKSLSYTLTYSENYSETGEGYTKAKTTNDNVPPSTAPSEEELINGFRVPAGKTYYCLLTITLNNLDGVDQSADLNAHLSTGFTIEEGIPQLLKDKMVMLSKGSIPDFNKVSPYPISYRDGIAEATDISQKTEYNLTGSGLVNLKTRYFTYADKYEYDEETGTYSLIDAKIGKYSEIYDNLLKEKYIVSYSGSPSSNIANHVNLEYIYFVKNNTTLDEINVKSITKVPLSYDYSNDGIFRAQDDYGISYYFRGAVTNNYLKFGKNEKGEDMYWRIVRLNGDGTLRIVYDGTQAWENGAGGTDKTAFQSKWNTEFDDNKYVGYMYEDEEEHKNTLDSTIKTKLDEWYEKVFKNTIYEKYLSDGIFCNDRSFATTNEGNGIGVSQTYYKAGDRMKTFTPDLKCSQQKDAFSMDNTIKGNGTLKYPIGLLTSDEAAFAGGSICTNGTNSSNNVFYLSSNTYTWLFSPVNYSNAAYVYGLSKRGCITSNVVSNPWSVTPVINIKAEYLDMFEGTGSASSPYELKIE